MNAVRFILLDIEGTTTDIGFVHQVLFPYSEKHLPEFVRDHADDPAVRDCLDQVKAAVEEEQGRTIDDRQVVEQLLAWIREDRKHTALKALQGMIWRSGYESGAYESHIYEDVLPCLKTWRMQGVGLGIYSSGSVEAQKLLFGHTPFGNLNSFFSRYFDTAVGGKRETASYGKIAGSLGLAPGQVLFLSDVEAELDAASGAGLQTVRVNRSGEPWESKHPLVQSFEALTFQLAGS